MLRSNLYSFSSTKKIRMWSIYIIQLQQENKKSEANQKQILETSSRFESSSYIHEDTQGNDQNVLNLFLI